MGWGGPILSVYIVVINRMVPQIVRIIVLAALPIFRFAMLRTSGGSIVGSLVACIESALFVVGEGSSFGIEMGNIVHPQDNNLLLDFQVEDGSGSGAYVLELCILACLAPFPHQPTISNQVIIAIWISGRVTITLSIIHRIWVCDHHVSPTEIFDEVILGRDGVEYTFPSIHEISFVRNRAKNSKVKTNIGVDRSRFSSQENK